MKRFSRILTMLDALVNGETIGGHGAFWRGLTLEQFTKRKVFGYPLLVIGDGANSNLILALRGALPFGNDIGTSGALFARMPARRPAASDSQIEYIQRWIDDGCPDDEDPGDLAAGLAVSTDPARHNDYWRTFDNRAMFDATQEVEDAIGVFMPTVGYWVQFAKNSASEPAWSTAIRRDEVQDALQLLSKLQSGTVLEYFGDPPDAEALFNAYARFGEGSLPVDALRPQDPSHKMNGKEMWFVWAAFADACLRSGIDRQFWVLQSRAILVGLIHDGVFRRRFRVDGFTADTAGSEAVVSYAAGLQESAIRPELLSRALMSGIF